MWATILTLSFLALSFGRLLKFMVGTNPIPPLSESDYTKSQIASMNGHSLSKTSSTASEILKKKYPNGSERYAKSSTPRR